MLGAVDTDEPRSASVEDSRRDEQIPSPTAPDGNSSSSDDEDDEDEDDDEENVEDPTLSSDDQLGEEPTSAAAEPEPEKQQLGRLRVKQVDTATSLEDGYLNYVTADVVHVFTTLMPNGGDQGIMKVTPQWRELMYQIDLNDLLLGDLTEKSLKRHAQSLLDGLIQERHYYPSRPVIFVAYDYGSLLVKEALSEASKSKIKFPWIFDSTARVIFSNCLQRSNCRESMLSNVLETLRQSEDSTLWPGQVSTSRTRGLVDAIYRTSEAFLESRITLKSRIISVYPSEPGKMQGSWADLGTFGLLSEISVEREGSLSTHLLTDSIAAHVNSGLDTWKPRDEWVYLHRAIMSVSSSERQLKRRVPSNLEEWSANFLPILASQACEKWRRMEHTQDQLLLLHGKSHTTNLDVANCIIQSHSKDMETARYGFRNTSQIFAFEFDSADATRNSATAMISSLIAQMMGRWGSTHSRLFETLENSFRIGAGWSDDLLINAFHESDLYNRESDVLLLHRLDQCEPKSRSKFLDSYRSASKRFEQALRIIVTTQDPDSIMNQDDDWGRIDVDFPPMSSMDGSQLWDAKVASLASVYPFDEEKGQIEKALGKIASVKDESREAILSLVHLHTSWPADASQEHLAMFLDFAETCVATDTTATVLDRILRSSADVELVQWVIMWLHHRHGPLLCRRELMTILSGSTASDMLSSSELPSRNVAELRRGTEALIRILVEPDREKLILRPEIREILTKNSDDGSAYLWCNLESKAHTVIVDFTFHHLALPSTKRSLQETMEEYDIRLPKTEISFLGQMKVPLCVEGLDVAFKLLHSLYYHLSQCHRDVPEDQPDVLLWTRAYWAMCNPFTRGPDPAQRPNMGFCNFAAIISGQPGDSDPIRRARYLAAGFAPSKAKNSASAALSAPASRPASPSTSSAPESQPGPSADWSPGVMGALFASLLASDKDLALSFAREVHDQSQESGVKTTWPKHLIWAAAWQDMPQLLDIFFSDGADPNASLPDDDYDPDDHLDTIRTDWVSPLYAATCFGHAEVVQVLLKHGARTDFCLDNSWSPTAVNMAVSHSHVEVLRLLLDHKPEELATPDQLLTLLYEASDSGFDSVIPELLGRILHKVKDSNASSGAESDDDEETSTEEQDSPESNPINKTPEGYSWSPLMGACAYGWPGSLKMLLESGADPNYVSPTDEGDTPLWQAMHHCPSLENVRQLVKHGVDPNREYQQIPVFLDYITKFLGKASEDRSDEFLLEMLEALLIGSHPMLVNAPDSVNQETALIVAAREGSLALLEWLLRHGADINMVDDRGRSALWHAVVENHVPVVRALLRWHPEPKLDILDKDSPATILSAATGSVEITEAILDAGVDVNVRNGDGPTAIDSAIGEDKDDVVKLLIERGADLKICDKDGWSPLATAIVTDVKSQVRMLVDAGADPDDVVNHDNLVYLAAGKPDILRIILEFGKRVNVNHRNDLGRTPLIRAASEVRADGSAEHLSLLLRAGADVRIQENDGETALHNAVRSGVLSYLPILLASPGIKVDHWQIGGHFSTPLSLASGYLNFPNVLRLLEHGADPNCVSEAYNARSTALISAGIPLSGNRGSDAGIADEIIRALVHRGGADVSLECPGRIFHTALSAAALGSGLSTVNFLMDEGPSTIQTPDHFGRRPIHYAAANGIENLKAIYQRDIQGLLASDRGSKTVAHWAAQFGNAQALSFILSKHDELGSASLVVDQPDGDGWTPLCWALRPLEGAYAPYMSSETRDYAGVVEALLSRGANPRLTCHLGRGGNDVEELTPIDIARRYGSSPEVIRLLMDRLEPTSPTQPPQNNGEEDKEEDKSESEAEGEDEAENAGQTPADNVETPTKKYKLHSGPACDICYMDISGLVFKCDACRDFLTCAKCVRNWATFHDGIYVRPEDEGKTHNMIIDAQYEEFAEDEVPPSPIASPKPPGSEAEGNTKEETDDSSDESDDNGSEADADDTEDAEDSDDSGK